MAAEDFEKIAAAIRRLAEREVLVGIPQTKDARPGEPIGNAALGWIHNYGSPARNIPARPFLEPGVEAALPEIEKRMRAAAEAALSGADDSALDALLGQAGQVAARQVQLTIRAGIPPPLAASTVARRRIRTPGSSYRRKAVTPAQVIPLIDTGQLIRAITFVVRDKRGG